MRRESYLLIFSTIVDLHSVLNTPDWLAMKAIFLEKLDDGIEGFDMVYWNRWICEEIQKKKEACRA